MADATQRGGQVTPERLEAFLRRQPEFEGATLSVALDTSRREAGASSGTNLFELRVERPDAPADTIALVFRYDLGGLFFRQYELAPQFATMRALRKAGFCAPEALWLDAEGVVAGRPGLVMKRVAAAAPSLTPFHNGPLMEASPAARRQMLLEAAKVIARMNRIDPAQDGFAHLAARGEGDHFIDREIGWTLRELRHAVPPPAPPAAKAGFYRDVRAVLEAVARWLADTAPRHRAPELAHGDANITNVMYRDGQVAALLDYELTHWGLGEADLAYQLAGIAHFRLLAAPVEGVPDEAEMIAAYREARGKFDDWAYAKVMGEWRLAVFAAMGLSRLPAEFDETEQAHWTATRARLAAMLPDLVGSATPENGK